MNQPIQLSLTHIDIKTDADLSDFGASSFAPIVSASREFLQGKVRELYFFGGEGSGKTHLLSAIHKAYLQTHSMAIFVSMQEIVQSDTQALAGLEMFNLIVLDDVHLAAHRPDWQVALFHLINQARSQKRQIIYSASGTPSDIQLTLADLITRLSQALSFALPTNHKPEDRRAILDAILRKKGWILPASIHDYLIAEGPQYPGDMAVVVKTIAPYLMHRRGKYPQKFIDGLKNAIKEKSLMIELADLELEPENKALE